MKKVLKWVLRVLCAVLALAALLILVLTLTEYRPADRETVTVGGSAEALPVPGQQLSLLSWNIGYGALGSNADFFMDGGSMVYTADEARLKANLSEMTAAAAKLSPDVLLLQEVDLASDRSYRTDETAVWKAAFPGTASAFAYNFNSLYVPYPLPPIGHVEGGLLTLSSLKVSSAERLSLPCPFSWPIRTVNLKRCLMATRIPVQGSGQELVVVNLHLEAYDSGEGKVRQTQALLSFLREEAAKGNWVIAGGDFNQRFSSVDQSAYPVYPGNWQPGDIDAADFAPDFTLLQDNSHPTCRSLDRPLDGASSENFQFYLIDGFIVSANVQVDSCETLDFGFTAADHNPVLLKVTLAE